MVQPFHQAFANEIVNEEETPTTLPTEVEEQLPDAEDIINDTEVQTESTESPEPSESIEVGNVDTPIESEVSSENDPETDYDESTIDQTASTTINAVDDSNDDTQSTTIDPVIGEDDNSTSTSTTGADETEVATSTATSTTDTGSDTSTTTATTTDDGAFDGSGSTDSSGGNDNDSSNDTNDTSETDNNDEIVEDEPNETDTGNDASSSTDDFIDNESIEDDVNKLVDGVVNEVVNLTRQLVTEENYYQFSRQSCVSVGDGTYHCSVKSDLPADSDSAVYAEQDEDGDMEIYLRTSKGDVKKLSDNSFDDTSPDLDLATMRVVWQRLVEGRYQIISYDLESREETQLTFSKNNSMEPRVSDEGIVWQAWDGNDWEVMYFDGQFTEQITDNNLQDVTPVVEDGYILWSVIGGEEAEARVYSLESEEVMTISGHEGGTVANPRFVLVYDTKFDNGDVITQGFDPVTGLAQTISAQPTELPFDIPEPDPVGEIRALIQNKSTQKGKDLVVVPTADDEGDLNLASSTASSTDIIILNELGLDQDAPTGDLDENADLVLNEYDLVITDNASSTDSQINADFNLVNVEEQTASSTQL